VTTTCFVSYEIHPTARGGCGVLIHHAIVRLLAAGHRVILLLDIPTSYVRTFIERDRLTLPNFENCRAYCVDELCADLPFSAADVPCSFQWRALRFAHALDKVLAKESVDFVEFFDYCGPAYYALAARLFGPEPAARPVLGCRLHNTMELFDRHTAVKDAHRLVLHGLERRAIDLCEVVLTPSRTYYEHYIKDTYRLEPQRVVISPPPKQAVTRVASRPDPKGPFTIAYVGRMFQYKGVEQLVRAAVMLMEDRPVLNFTVELMGYDSDEGPVPGSYTAYLKTLIPPALLGRFVFTGFLSHEEIAQRLPSALFTVLPNLMESFCYALHELYDLGLPVIINDLPAFRDFFTHERNCLVYNGTIPALLAAMKRLIDEPALRERLCFPYPVAENPLGDFYANPGTCAPLAPDGEAGAVRDPLAVVLCDSSNLADCPALTALAGQTTAPARVICLVPADLPGEERLWWLSKPWHARTPAGERIPTSQLLTTDAIAVLQSDDAPNPQWLETCVRALSRRPQMAFAGTWPRCGGRPIAMSLDVTPELYPFERGNELARVVARTRPGLHLADLLDSGCGALGHTGYLWQALAQWGHGVLSPTPLIDVEPARAQPAEANALRSLVMRFGEPLAERLRLVAGLLAPQPTPTTVTPAPLPIGEATVEQKVALADELGGKTLARLALKKLARRVVSPTASPRQR
jgi:glycosyltransferase involved in cell wall biosynthesis